jgi:hypothetical protein
MGRRRATYLVGTFEPNGFDNRIRHLLDANFFVLAYCFDKTLGTDLVTEL